MPPCPFHNSSVDESGSTKAPSIGVEQPRSIIPLMLEALCEHLLEKTGLYQDKIVLFLLDEFKTLVMPFSIGRVLASIG